MSRALELKVECLPEDQLQAQELHQSRVQQSGLTSSRMPSQSLRKVARRLAVKSRLSRKKTQSYETQASASTAMT